MKLISLWPSSVCTRKILLITTVCNIYIKTVLRSSISLFNLPRLKTAQVTSVTSPAAPVCSTWHGALLSDGVHEVKKLHVKCHYYCTRTITSVTSVSRVTENRDISVVFLTFLGSKAVVVLSGVLGLVNLLFVECTDCETLPVVVVVGKPQVCYAKG